MARRAAQRRWSHRKRDLVESHAEAGAGKNSATMKMILEVLANVRKVQEQGTPAASSSPRGPMPDSISKCGEPMALRSI